MFQTASQGMLKLMADLFLKTLIQTSLHLCAKSKVLLVSRRLIQKAFYSSNHLDQIHLASI